jgi:hypothetical protein
MWTGALQLGGQRLADRAATYQAATAMLRHMERLAGWTRWARSCGYFDDGYEAAQLWLNDWEQQNMTEAAGEARRPIEDDEARQSFGDTLVGRAQTIIRNLDPMRQAQA